MKKLLIIILISICGLGYAQSLDQKLMKPSKLYVGTPFQLLIEITSDPEDIIYTTPIDTLDVFILRDMKTEETSLEKQNMTALNMNFQAFDTGEFTFPELEFAVISQTDTTFLRTNEFVLFIDSVVPEENSEIMDIADPLPIKLGFWDYFLPLLALAVLIIVILLIVRLIKAKSHPVKPPQIIDKRPAYEIVLALLADLKKEKFLEKSQYLRFHFRLSYLLRLFLELHYKISTVEMTTSEIKTNLQPNSSQEKSQIMDFLIFADKVKFAKFEPTFDQSQAALAWLENYLTEFKTSSEAPVNDREEN